MKPLLRYLTDYKKECVLGPLFKLLEALFELFVPLVMAKLIDVGIGNGEISYVLRMGLLLVGLGIIGLISSVTAQYFAAKAATGFASQLRSALFAHIQSFSFTEIDAMGTAGMITRMTSDINQTQNGVNMVLRLFLRSPFIVFGAMIMAFTIDKKAAVIFAVTIPLLSLVIFGIMAAGIPLYQNVQGHLDTLLGLTRENLEGVRVLRAFHKEEEEKERFREQNQMLKDLQSFAGKISSLMNPATYLILNLATVVLIYCGAIQVNLGSLTQGQVVALLNYMSQILVELVKLANLIVTITKALSCARRIGIVLEEESSMKDGSVELKEETILQSQKPLFTFLHAGLKYQNSMEEALSDLTFVVNKGETVGVIGGTGAGKTSLVHLLPRFYDITGGSLMLLERDLKEYTISSLRSCMGIVMQKAVLFEGTIRENLCMRKEDATREEMISALKAAQAYDFVMEKPQELEYKVDQGGKNLSGGQRQRLAIARALVGNPPILILDDSASALDYATDAALRKALRELPGNPTIFLVSQRTSSIRHADKIIVLEDGNIAGIGRHEELLENCEVYREIYDSQNRMGGEE